MSASVCTCSVPDFELYISYIHNRMSCVTDSATLEDCSPDYRLPKVCLSFVTRNNNRTLLHFSGLLFCCKQFFS